MSGLVPSLNVEVTSNGFNKITNALLTNTNITVSSFKIGSAYGFTPLINEPGVRDLVFTQTLPNQMQPILQNPDTIDFKIVIDSSLGPFQIGNLGLYLNDGTLFAIAVMTLPDHQIPQSNGIVGTSYEYDIIVVVTGLGVVINPTILIDTYAVIPFVSTELALPSPISPPYSVYRVVSHTDTNLSTMAVQDPVNQEWLGTPFMNDIQSDYFVLLDGGCGNDVVPYVPTSRVTWGNYYRYISDNPSIIDFNTYGTDGTAVGNWDFGSYG